MHDAGWHLSSFGGVERVQEKLLSYIGAKEYGNDVYLDPDRLGRLIRNGVGVYELASSGIARTHLQVS